MLHYKFSEHLNKRERFNPLSKEHLNHYSNYLKSGSWSGNCPFLLEWPFNDIPTMVSSMILAAHMDSLSTNTKDK